MVVQSVTFRIFQHAIRQSKPLATTRSDATTTPWRHHSAAATAAAVCYIVELFDVDVMKWHWKPCGDICKQRSGITWLSCHASRDGKWDKNITIGIRIRVYSWFRDNLKPDLHHTKSDGNLYQTLWTFPYRIAYAFYPTWRIGRIHQTPFHLRQCKLNIHSTTTKNSNTHSGGSIAIVF